MWQADFVSLHHLGGDTLLVGSSPQGLTSFFSREISMYHTIVSSRIVGLSVVSAGIQTSTKDSGTDLIWHRPSPRASSTVNEQSKNINHINRPLLGTWQSSLHKSCWMNEPQPSPAEWSQSIFWNRNSIGGVITHNQNPHLKAGIELQIENIRWYK